MSREVARHYAEVLLEVAVEGGNDLDGLAAHLDDFAAACADSTELRDALSSPAVPRAARVGFAEAVAKRIGPEDALFSRFISTLVTRDRAESLVEVGSAFRAVLDAHRGIVPAEVTSAVELDDAAREEIRGALAESLGGTPRLEFRVDPALLGGVVVRSGNRIYDASLSGALARFTAAHAGDAE